LMKVYESVTSMGIGESELIKNWGDYVPPKRRLTLSGRLADIKLRRLGHVIRVLRWFRLRWPSTFF
jgi:hypothetical protein